MRRIAMEKIHSLMDTDWILSKAEASLLQAPVYITDARSAKSPGNEHEFYSNGDYWWPDPSKPDGLPFIQRDGESNPDAFTAHREIMRSMRTHVANLSAGYLLTGKEAFAEKAVSFLNGFFLDETTRMLPHLLYAQAIPGICTGRGIGIIDTLHLIDIPHAVNALTSSRAMTPDILDGLKNWFAEYLEWMNTHPYGLAEKNAGNNHSVCWHVQASVFAEFTGNQEMLDECRHRYKTFLLPLQMAPDGSFPRELARTKPYGYSIFVLDNMAVLCQTLSTADENLWAFELEDGRGIRRGMDYLYPYLVEKESWPYPPDIMHDEGWPTQVSCLLFAGLAYGDESFIRLWGNLNPDPTDAEIRRNISVRQPILWIAEGV